ncbi:MAG: hypothetical protein AVDCRST_MAG53-447 [uncultured Solirubrobacteraceae bacterium]|uniref:Uncharacterized protein n=1 Tax=uncultured Solirubrobacteraceae bacterium TaxID=1162706 RepID=A0A6J4RUU2_9ACTN|nr:MAG: hypothetical protein AVDCRST_MAG53-447 [uncultured Solirubrobacteraceae bacterium]
MPHLPRLLVLCLALVLTVPAVAAASGERLPSTSVLGGGFKTVKTFDIPASSVVKFQPGVAASSVASASVREFRRRTRAKVTETAFVGVYVFKDPGASSAYFNGATSTFSGAGSVATEKIGEASAARRSTYSIDDRRKRSVQLLYLKGNEVWEVSVVRARSKPRPSVGTVVGIARRNAARG